MIKGLVVLTTALALFLGTQRPDLTTHDTGSGAGAVQAEENIKFRWAFGAIVGKDRKFVSVNKDTQLATGDELKMLVELKKKCYVYVVHRSPGGTIALLFPYSLKQFSTDYVLNKNYYIPMGRDWFKLDKTTGVESFHLIASADRLGELEDLLGQYAKADPEKKADLAELIIAEIRNVRKRYKTFTTLAERPISIGGNIRGVDKVEEARKPDVANVAKEISANNFYSRTFTLDHQ
ncbi:MAG: DUF4384 domain-containing protein [Ignavibacteria bacterium]|nr:DUF4384 domain-containing protein [Ignavibacteria bacterium]